MGKKILKVSGVPTLSIVKCEGDLIVQGSPRAEVILRADEDRVKVSQEGDTIMVTCKSDLRFDAPYGSSLRVQKTEGDVAVKRIQGVITLDATEGDLVLSRVGPATVGQVKGDFSARVVDGDLIVGEVQGDVSVRGVSGQLKIDLVGRDLGVRELQGDALAKEVQGDVRLRTQFLAGKSYRFQAGGDIVARVRPNSDADLTLRSGSDSIRVKAPLADRVDGENMVTGRLGAGGATVELAADKDVILVARDSGRTEIDAGFGALGAEIGIEFGSEFAGLADEIAAQVQAHMDDMNAHLEEKLANLDADLAGIDHRAARAAERAAEQARRQVEQAAERLRRQAEREADKARRRAEKARWRAARRPTRPKPPKAPKPEYTGEPVSDTERLAILNMVAEGKISIEDAESLLEALNN